MGVCEAILKWKTEEDCKQDDVCMMKKKQYKIR